MASESVIVRRRITSEGVYYSKEGLDLGPFTIKQESKDPFDAELAAKLGDGVTNKAIMQARLASVQEEILRERLDEALGSTIKRDNASKSISFLNMLLAQTEGDQFNIGFQAESSTGKSYIPLELLDYFLDVEKRTYAGASPTNFYHEVGRYVQLSELAKEIPGIKGVFDEKELADEKRKAIVVDLSNKILVFLDQPHWSLLEKLRPLLSHDKKYLRYSITDKTGKGGLRSKTVIIIGYPSVFFCTTKPSQDDQERTRLCLLSPEANCEKIREGLYLLAEKLGNRKAFSEKIEQDPLRCWLKERIHLIRDSHVREIVIPDSDKVLKRFLGTRPHLAPRHQRDFPRLMSYIKGFALLNVFTRQRLAEDTIVADPRDVDSGFALYELVAESNELGISPETYRIYKELIVPLAAVASGVGFARVEIVKKHFELYGRPLAWDRLTKQILPSLESAGLVREDKNPDDKREMLVYTPVPSGISPTANNTGDMRGVPHLRDVRLDQPAGSLPGHNGVDPELLAKVGTWFVNNRTNSDGWVPYALLQSSMTLIEFESLRAADRLEINDETCSLVRLKGGS